MGPSSKRYHYCSTSKISKVPNSDNCFVIHWDRKESAKKHKPVFRTKEHKFHISKGFMLSIFWGYLLACPIYVILDFRNIALDTTNRQADTVIPDSLFRVQVQRCEREDWVSKSFEAQQASILNTLSSSQISRQSNSLFLGCNTIFKFDRLQKSQTASLQFLKGIADYIELGRDIWYCLHDDAIEFLDGDEELDSREPGPRKSSFR